MKLTRFKAEHTRRLIEQDATRWLSGYLDDANLKMLEQHPSVTAFDGNTVVGCGGLVQFWPGRAEVWVMLSKDAGKHFVSVHRTAKDWIDIQIRLLELRRVELVVDVNFGRAHKWARMLGFELEREEMLSYFPDGRSAAMYVRIK